MRQTNSKEPAILLQTLYYTLQQLAEALGPVPRAMIRRAEELVIQALLDVREDALRDETNLSHLLMRVDELLAQQGEPHVAVNSELTS